LRFNHGTAPEKYERLRMMMGLNPNADLAEAVEQMNADIGLPPSLSAMGVTSADVEELVKYATIDLSGRTNPREAGEDDYRKLFEASLG
jgi:4-hydroxybutyrate dehydrogenase